MMVADQFDEATVVGAFDELLAKLAKHGLAEDDGNMEEAYSRYMSETEDGPAERKEMCKAMEELKKPSEADPDPDKDGDKDGKALARIYERQLASLAKRVQVAESVAAKVASETEARAKKEHEAKLAAFRKEMIESAEARYLPEQAADLDQLIADVGGDLDKARVHAMRMPPVAAFKRLTQGGNPVGLTSVPPPGLSAMSRTDKGYSFNAAVAELRKKEPGLSLALAQQRVAAEQPDLYDGAL